MTDPAHIYCGLKQQPPGYRYDTSDYDLFQVIVVFSGELFLTVQNVVTILRGGAVCCLPVGSAFHLHCNTAGYRGIFVTLSGVRDLPYRGEAGMFPTTPEIRLLSRLIEEEARNPADRSEEMLAHLGSLLANWGVRLARGRQQQVADDTAPEVWVHHACQCIRKTIYTSQSLEECLGGIPLSYRQLSRHFHAVLGYTPKQFQLQCRIREAERLLCATRLSVTSIALELGFASSQHFSTQFARFCGLPPSTYRAKQRA